MRRIGTNCSSNSSIWSILSRRNLAKLMIALRIRICPMLQSISASVKARVQYRPLLDRLIDIASTEVVDPHGLHQLHTAHQMRILPCARAARQLGSEGLTARGRTESLGLNHREDLGCSGTASQQSCGWCNLHAGFPDDNAHGEYTLEIEGLGSGMKHTVSIARHLS